MKSPQILAYQKCTYFTNEQRVLLFNLKLLKKLVEMETLL